MQKKAIDIGRGASVAAFILAARMLEAGSADDRGWQMSFWLTLFAFVAALVAFPVLSLASNELWDEKKGIFNKIIFVAVGAAVLWAAVYLALDLTKESTEFVTRSMDMGVPDVAVAGILLATCGYMAGFDIKTLKKFAFVAYAFAILSSGVLLIMALCRGGLSTQGIIRVMSLENVKDAASVDLIVSRFLKVFAPSVIVIVWLADGSSRKRGAISSLLGLLMGSFGLLICYISTEVVLGLPYASQKSYPYLRAVGSMTAGKLFLRPEGFVYLSYLWVTILGIAVCISLACRLIDRRGRMKKRLPFFVAAFVLAAYIILFAKIM